MIQIQVCASGPPTSISALSQTNSVRRWRLAMDRCHLADSGKRGYDIWDPESLGATQIISAVVDLA
jgi:hypothetical protein